MRGLAFIFYVLLEADQIEFYRGTKVHFILWANKHLPLSFNIHCIVSYHITPNKINVFVFYLPSLLVFTQEDEYERQ